MNWCSSLTKARPDVQISSVLRTAVESSAGAKWAGVEFPTGYNPHVQAMRLTMASTLEYLRCFSALRISSTYYAYLSI